jgi:phosphoglycerol transferase MdoB-like AlkP superfamily enzyme
VVGTRRRGATTTDDTTSADSAAVHSGSAHPRSADAPPDRASSVDPGDTPTHHRRHRWWRTELGRVTLAGLLLTFLWAAACNAFLNVLQGFTVLNGLWWLVHENPGSFVVSTALIWVVLGALVAVVGRVVPASALLLVALVPLGLANHEKLMLRAEPVYPADLTYATHPGFLADMAGFRVLDVVGLVVVVSVLGTLVWLSTRLARRRVVVAHWRRGGRAWRPWLIARAVMLVAAVLLLSQLRGFHGQGNPVRGAYDAAGTRWAPWSQRTNAMHNGLVASLLYNLDVTAMKRPAGYSEARMQEIADRYQAVADRMNRGRSPSALRDSNVVVVLSESFSDPRRVPGISLAEDPLPFTRQLMARTPSGSMRSPLIGGGTANIEFEALTGQSTSQFNPQMTTPYQMLVPKERTYPSAVGYFEAKGDRTVAIHPFRPQMYRRDEVYPILGFDRTVFQSDMHERHRIDENPFIDDASGFDEVLRTLRETDQSQFVQLVTMQNHYPTVDNYSDPIPVTGIEGDGADQLSHYARGLRYSDAALKSFLGSLRQSDKRTTVVFYGDHTPPFWVKDTSPTANGLDESDAVLHETPYLLWSNKGDLSKPTSPVTDPIYFLPMLLDEMGAPLPPYYALLLRLQHHVPALLPGEYLRRDGEGVSQSALDARSRRLLEDYRLVQYDLSVGHRYVAGRMFDQQNEVSR